MKETIEQANKKINEYIDILGHSGLNVCYTNDLDKESKLTAIECTLLDIDNIIEALDEHFWQNRHEIEYWKEIKKEVVNIYGQLS